MTQPMAWALLVPATQEWTRARVQALAPKLAARQQVEFRQGDKGYSVVASRAPGSELGDEIELALALSREVAESVYHLLMHEDYWGGNRISSYRDGRFVQWSSEDPLALAAQLGCPLQQPEG